MAHVNLLKQVKIDDRWVLRSIPKEGQRTTRLERFAGWLPPHRGVCHEFHNDEHVDALFRESPNPNESAHRQLSTSTTVLPITPAATPA